MLRIYTQWNYHEKNVPCGLGTVSPSSLKTSNITLSAASRSVGLSLIPKNSASGSLSMYTWFMDPGKGGQDWIPFIVNSEE